MGDYGKFIKGKHLSSLILCALATFLLAIESKADIEPDFNIAVKIAPAAAVAYLNEKIEVYCEKDGQFYMTIDLNKNNRYEYKKLFENGVYTFQARVRYDMNGEYTILPDIQAVELTYKNNNILNEVVFTVSGMSTEPELHTHLTDESKQPEDSSKEEKVYTIDDIDELYEIQESMIAEAEAAFTEQEVWEQNHNFVSKYEIADQKIFGNESSTFPMHVYPETTAESVESDGNPKNEDLITSTAEMTGSEEENGDLIKQRRKTRKQIAVFIMILMSLLILLIPLYLLWRNQDE